MSYLFKQYWEVLVIRTLEGIDMLLVVLSLKTTHGTENDSKVGAVKSASMDLQAALWLKHPLVAEQNKQQIPHGMHAWIQSFELFWSRSTVCWKSLQPNTNIDIHFIFPWIRCICRCMMTDSLLKYSDGFETCKSEEILISNWWKDEHLVLVSPHSCSTPNQPPSHLGKEGGFKMLVYLFIDHSNIWKTESLGDWRRHLEFSKIKVDWSAVLHLLSHSGDQNSFHFKKL